VRCLLFLVAALSWVLDAHALELWLREVRSFLSCFFFSKAAPGGVCSVLLVAAPSLGKVAPGLSKQWLREKCSL
jgi:hypothetical protein